MIGNTGSTVGRRLYDDMGRYAEAETLHLEALFVPFATIQNWVEAGGEKGGSADVDELPRLGAG